MRTQTATGSPNTGITTDVIATRTRTDIDHLVLTVPGSILPIGIMIIGVVLHQTKNIINEVIGRGHVLRSDLKSQKTVLAMVLLIDVTLTNRVEGMSLNLLNNLKLKS